MAWISSYHSPPYWYEVSHCDIIIIDLLILRRFRAQIEVKNHWRLYSNVDAFCNCMFLLNLMNVCGLKQKQLGYLWAVSYCEPYCLYTKLSILLTWSSGTCVLNHLLFMMMSPRAWWPLTLLVELHEVARVARIPNYDCWQHVLLVRSRAANQRQSRGGSSRMWLRTRLDERTGTLHCQLKNA